MKKKEKLNSLIDFTENIYEMTESGMSLQKAAESLSGIKEMKNSVRKCAAEISESLKNGSSFFMAASSSMSMCFPDWYLALTGTAEKTGSVMEVLGYCLEILRQQKKDEEKYFSSLLYPLSVAFLALLAGFVILFSFSGSFSSSYPGTEVLFMADSGEIKASFVYGLTFLFLSYGVLILLQQKFLAPEKEILFLSSLYFLLKNSVSVSDALKACFAFAEGNKKLEKALFVAQKKLHEGRKISESFSSGFRAAGYRNLERLLEVNLELSEISSSFAGFKKTSGILESRRRKKIEAFLGLEQPFLMAVTAVYLVILLKNLILPVMAGAGG